MFTPVTVHTEALMLDNVWEEAKKLAISGKVRTWYVMTPANYEYLKMMFNFKMTQEQLSKTLEERYKWLINHGQDLQLHLHLCIIMNISKSEQEKLFKESLQWMKEKLNIVPKEFVPGWWTDNSETREILKKYNIKRITRTTFKAIHDYDLVRGKGFFIN
jgi:hypothetical protein